MFSGGFEGHTNRGKRVPTFQNGVEYKLKFTGEPVPGEEGCLMFSVNEFPDTQWYNPETDVITLGNGGELIGPESDVTTNRFRLRRELKEALELYREQSK